MNETSNENLANRESRYAVQEEQALTVTVVRQLNQESLPATVANLSLGGAKLVVSLPLSFTELIRVNLTLSESDVRFDVPARICWARPIGDGTYSVGCAFSERLTPEVLNSLSELGYLERRAHGRVQVDFPALSKWELSDTISTVQVLDYSIGGFVMVSRQRAQADQQLMLEISTEHQVFTLSARVVWQTRMEESYRIGCSFIGKKDAETMARAARVIHGDDETVTKPDVKAKTKSLSAVALIAITLLTAGGYHYWFRTEPRRQQGYNTVPVSVVVSSTSPPEPVTQPPETSELAADRVQPELTEVIDDPPVGSPEPSSAILIVEAPNVVTDAPEANSDTTLLNGIDQRVRECVQRANSGAFRAALTDLGVVVKQYPRDPAYRYMIASVASNAGFHGFAEVQFDLGWKLEQRYPSSTPLRLLDALTSQQGEWLKNQRAIRLKSVQSHN